MAEASNKWPSLPTTHISFTSELFVCFLLVCILELSWTSNQGHLQSSPEELLKEMCLASALGGLEPSLETKVWRANQGREFLGDEGLKAGEKIRHYFFCFLAGSS